MTSASMYSISTGAIALTAATTQSLWLLNPANDSSTIAELSVSFNGSSVAQAIEVDLYRVNSLGSAAGTAAVVNQWTDTTTASSGENTALTALTVEPTSVFVLSQWYVSPFSGLLVIQYPLGREPGTQFSGSRVGLRCITPAGVSPSALSYVIWQE
jgi:hypothetical protein